MKEDVCMMTSQPDRDVVNETDNCGGAWAGPVSWLGTWNVRMCCVTPLLCWVTIALTGDSTA